MFVGEQQIERSVVVPFPAPTKGWCTRDPLAAMDPLYAPIFHNWWPLKGYVTWRPGCREHATGVGSGAVNTIMSYVGTSGTRKLLAVGSDYKLDRKSVV